MRASCPSCPSALPPAILKAVSGMLAQLSDLSVPTFSVTILREGRRVRHIADDPVMDPSLPRWANGCLLMDGEVLGPQADIPQLGLGVVRLSHVMARPLPRGCSVISVYCEWKQQRATRALASKGLLQPGALRAKAVVTFPTKT